MRISDWSSDVCSSDLIMDITAVGGRAFATHCLIKYRGRKSGKTFITPLCYADIGGEVVICGSKGGADHHPEWYLNIVASPEIEFQIATQAFRATWREPVGAEREKVSTEARRVGKEGVRTCRYVWSPFNKQKKKTYD